MKVNFTFYSIGPLVTMMGKMVKNMIYFVVLLLVVLMSFGVSRQSILNPNEEPRWRLVRDVFFQPYFMLYGEVFADDIDPPCGEDPTQPPCITGHWITPIAMSMYLLIANILLINLLIAVFNNIFNETNSISHQVWMFQRFTVVMEYQQKPVLPPPLIAFCHFYSLLKYLIRKTKNLKEVRDNGLKLFLEKDDLEKLYDFEEECVEGFFHEQNCILQQSTEERIRNTDDRVETMTQKIEDINVKENLQSLSIQNMEFRLRKMEESTEQILSHLAVIHRFMSTHISNENLQGSMANIMLPTAVAPMLDSRMRTVSENDSSNVLVIPQPRVRKIGRSLTEVRPDAYIFDDGAHYEARNVLKEMSSEDISDLQLIRAPRKLSVQSEEPEYCVTPTSQQGAQSETAEVDMGTPVVRSESTSRRPPNLGVRQETKETDGSAESRDTLTPLDLGDDKNILNAEQQQNAIDETETTNYEGLRQRIVPSTKRRNSQIVRRNSETHNLDINRSQNSLNIAGTQLMARRQFSLTQSEPESDIPSNSNPKPIVTKPGRHLLLQIHTEYTSITDELESMIASPTVSLMDEKPKNINELSNPEFAALIEKKHLKECEDDDYMIMERLLETRCSIDEGDENFEVGFASDYAKGRMLRRETAIELPVTPKKLLAGVENSSTESPEFHVKNEKTASVSRNISVDNNKLSPLSSSNHNSPRNSKNLTGVTYLNPAEVDLHRSGFYKKSSESLQKNSSTETDYSAQPYHVIKQSSNETNSSINIDNTSFTHDLSIEADTSLNSTVVESMPEERVLPPRASTMSSTEGRSSFLRKQFSIDCGKKTSDIRPHSESFEFRSTVRTHESSQHHHIPPVVPPRISVISRNQMNALNESSSTSTEDTRDDSRKVIPSISTHLVQDEIVKLSSNIKNSVDEETTSTTTVDDTTNNETMC
jgi:transient receptor potential cation channel subfamily M member 3